MEGAKYATWSAPTDVGAAPPERVRLPMGFWLIGALASVVFVALLAIPFGLGAVSVLGGVALGAFFACRVTLISVGSEWFARRRKGSAAAYAMYKSLGIDGAHPVRIEVILGGYAIGRDEGLAIFDGAAMEFFGSRTRFKIDNSHEMNPFVTGLILPKVDNMEHAVRVQPFERLDPNNDTFREHLYWRDYMAWEKAENGLQIDEVLPPRKASSRRDVSPLPARPAFLDGWLFVIVFANLAGDIERGFTWILPALWIVTLMALWILGLRRHKRFLAKVL